MGEKLFMTPPTILRGKGAPKAFTKEISINVLQESLVPSNILEECHNLLAAALADIFAMKRLTVSKERLYRVSTPSSLFLIVLER